MGWCGLWDGIRSGYQAAWNVIATTIVLNLWLTVQGLHNPRQGAMRNHRYASRHSPYYITAKYGAQVHADRIYANALLIFFFFPEQYLSVCDLAVIQFRFFFFQLVTRLTAVQLVLARSPQTEISLQSGYRPVKHPIRQWFSVKLNLVASA